MADSSRHNIVTVAGHCTGDSVATSPNDTPPCHYQFFTDCYLLAKIIVHKRSTMGGGTSAMVHITIATVDKTPRANFT